MKKPRTTSCVKFGRSGKIHDKNKILDQVCKISKVTNINRKKEFKLKKHLKEPVTEYFGFKRKFKNPFSYKKLYPEKVKQVRTLCTLGKPNWKKNNKTRRIIGN